LTSKLALVFLDAALVIGGCLTAAPLSGNAQVTGASRSTAGDARRSEAKETPGPSDPVTLAALLPADQKLEKRLDGDLNGDGRPDIAFVGRNAESAATLYVASAAKGPSIAPYSVLASGRLATSAPGQVGLAIEQGVLIVDFEIGGTTRVNSTYRLRYDDRAKAMRLIGFDMTTYDKMLAHDTTALSWNLVTGRVVRSVAKATTRDDGPPAVKTQSKRLVAPILLNALPAPDEIEALITKPAR
jgi:hypothetical protein